MLQPCSFGRGAWHDWPPGAECPNPVAGVVLMRLPDKGEEHLMPLCERHLVSLMSEPGITFRPLEGGDE